MTSPGSTSLDSGDWAGLEGSVLVIDTNSQYVYIGTLSRIADHFVVLKDVDVHDRTETPTTKEEYIMNCKRFGVRPNRKEVSVRKLLVVSVSKLDDVVLY